MTKIPKKLWEFFSKNKDTALHILTLIQQERNFDEIKTLLRTRYNLTSDQIDAFAEVANDYEVENSEYNIRHLTAAIELSDELFRDYGLLLHHARSKLGDETVNSYIRSVASLNTDDEILKIIQKVLNACYKNGDIDIDHGLKIIQAFSKITTPKDPFIEQVEKVDQIIENIGKDIRSVIGKAKKKVKKMDSFLDKWEDWIDAKSYRKKSSTDSNEK